jgi:DNA-nicking Smr family endonuclease
MKSPLRTALALLVTSVPWLAMIAQSQQQEMNPRSEQRMESAQPEKPAGDSANSMKMMPDKDCAKMKKGKMDKNKAKQMKKKEDKQNSSSSGFSIYG